MRKRVFSLLCVCVMLLSLAPSAAASSDTSYLSRANFFTWAIDGLKNYTSPLLGDNNGIALTGRVLQGVLGGIGVSGVCIVSDDTRHHAKSFEYVSGTGYYRCICSECGHTFLAYAKDIEDALEETATSSGKTTEQVLQDAYDNYVSVLPAQSIDSDGALYWSPQPDAIYLSDSNSGSNIYAGWGNIDASRILSQNTFQAQFVSSSSRIFIYPASEKTYISGTGYRYALGSFRDTAPVSGFYQLAGSQSAFLNYPIDFSSHAGQLHYIRADNGGDVFITLGTANYSLSGNKIVIRAFELLYNSSSVFISVDDVEIPVDLHTAGTYSSPDLPGVSITVQKPVSAMNGTVSLMLSGLSEDSVFYNIGESVFYNSGASFSNVLQFAHLPASGEFLNYIYCTVISPKYRIQPLSGYIDTSNDNIYNKSTRSFSGAYGIIDGDGNVQQISSTSIVNETDNSVYNPVTNTSNGITNWSYDYSDRSYNLKLDDGSDMTVTYGNENVTIVQGDAVYNVYYVTETEQETPVHTHNYISEITTEPTCVLSGVRTYTCECGESYTQSIAALGHNWVVKQDVKTQYDNDGNMIQQGYVVYECSRCGEQYKTESSGGVPSPGGGGDSSGSGASSDSEENGGILGKIGKLFGTVASIPLKIIEGALGKILDGLISIAETISDKLSDLVQMVLGWFDVIPTLFGGFLSFLSAMFGFLPSELVTLMSFGLASVVFIGIVKAIRR